MKKCYLCESHSFLEIDGEVRDKTNLKIKECKDCRLISLNSFEHIKSGYYENSWMHGKEIQTKEFLLQNAEWDDQRLLNAQAHITTQEYSGLLLWQ